ncbi:MAG: hypothetical protein HN377_13155 [Alphaproteobacteria bacterium]|jgi:hypothetical protein|nr:hypothetical protein [Alphaproteobacteria bacterium]MBT7943697.1 hypothetical protein [Alphaproteobacteria bacterium]
MLSTFFMRIYVGLVVVLSIGGLVYVYTAPLESMRANRDGVPYFTPPVINPETGEPVPVDTLVRHFKGQ